VWGSLFEIECGALCLRLSVGLFECGALAIMLNGTLNQKCMSNILQIATFASQCTYLAQDLLLHAAPKLKRIAM